MTGWGSQCPHLPVTQRTAGNVVTAWTTLPELGPQVVQVQTPNSGVWLEFACLHLLHGKV